MYIICSIFKKNSRSEIFFEVAKLYGLRPVYHILQIITQCKTTAEGCDLGCIGH